MLFTQLESAKNIYGSFIIQVDGINASGSSNDDWRRKLSSTSEILKKEYQTL